MIPQHTSLEVTAGYNTIKMEDNTNNQIDKTVSYDDFQDITRVTSKSIHSTLVKRIQIPPTAQSKFNSFYITSKSMCALWLVNQLWVIIVPVNPRKNP